MIFMALLWTHSNSSISCAWCPRSECSEIGTHEHRVERNNDFPLPCVDARLLRPRDNVASAAVLCCAVLCCAVDGCMPKNYESPWRVSTHLSSVRMRF